MYMQANGAALLSKVKFPKQACEDLSISLRRQLDTSGISKHSPVFAESF